MRFSAILASVLLLYGQVSPAGDARSACNMLSESEISMMAGEAMRAIRKEADRQRLTCTYGGESKRISVSFLQAGTQRAALQQFTDEINKGPGGMAAYEPLRGVGAEARYRALDSKDGGTIVARFGAVVVVLSGNLERTALVELARAAAAHLAEMAHPSD